MFSSKILVWMRRYISSATAFILTILLLGHGVTRIASPYAVAVNANTEGSVVRVVIDAGHGGEDCGAIGVNGVYEKDINLKISNILAGYLRAAGILVVETRKDDKLLYDPDIVPYGHRKATDLANRAKIASAYADAVFISIHMNSFPQEKYHGLQVWYNGRDEAAARLAADIQSGVTKRLQPDNHRCVKPSGGNMYLLDHTECTSVLVECGFLTNREECDKLTDPEYQKELSFVLFCAIINYLEANEQETS